MHVRLTCSLQELQIFRDEDDVTIVQIERTLPAWRYGFKGELHLMVVNVPDECYAAIAEDLARIDKSAVPAVEAALGAQPFDERMRCRGYDVRVFRRAETYWLQVDKDAPILMGDGKDWFKGHYLPGTDEFHERLRVDLALEGAEIGERYIPKTSEKGNDDGRAYDKV